MVFGMHLWPPFLTEILLVAIWDPPLTVAIMAGLGPTHVPKTSINIWPEPKYFLALKAPSWQF